ncbi:hypothetical protein CVT26_014449 [Gymnopilus dilepis]|uniref:Uncharacterized protein n=1 Tax=Gymnopilus dilepis TaxID=231916 RepID=A0A409VV83_9AGAR|nr:hypothetical protein CVT26_014449 [Gymnopilus dilepis]
MPMHFTDQKYDVALLIYRIWQEEKFHDRIFDGRPEKFVPPLRKIMRIIIESGLLYTSVAFATFVTAVIKTYGIYVTTAFEVQIVGIAFNLIIIRTSRLSQRVEVNKLEHASNGITSLQFASVPSSTSSNPTSCFESRKNQSRALFPDSVDIR